MRNCCKCGSDEVIQSFNGNPICFSCWKNIAEKAAIFEMRCEENRKEIDKIITGMEERERIEHKV